MPLGGREVLSKFSHSLVDKQFYLFHTRKGKMEEEKKGKVAMGNSLVWKKGFLVGGIVVLPLIISALYLSCSPYNLKFRQPNFTGSEAERKAIPTTLGMAQPDQTLADGGSTQITTIGGVTIERNPSQSKLFELGVSSWPKYESSPCKIPWTFNTKETMYLLEGKAIVSCDGYDGSFEIGGGDLVVFPQGMKITWEVIESVKKHYHLDK